MRALSICRGIQPRGYPRSRIVIDAEARSESFTIGAGYFWFMLVLSVHPVQYAPLSALALAPRLGVFSPPSTALTGGGIIADTFVQLARSCELCCFSPRIVWLLTDITTFVPFMVVIALLSVVLLRSRVCGIAMRFPRSSAGSAVPC